MQKFQQGGRGAYHFVLDLPTPDGLLPQQVDKTIQEYLTGRDDWFSIPITLAIGPEAVEFTPDDAPLPPEQPLSVRLAEEIIGRRCPTRPGWPGITTRRGTAPQPTS